MKKNQLHLIILAFGLLCTSCQTVYFTEAQPKGNAEEIQMPASFLGHYMALGSPEDPNLWLVNIHENGYILYEKIQVEISLDSIYSTPDIYLEDSLIYAKKIHEQMGFPYTQAEDQISFHYYEWEESLLKEENISLKKDKGAFYLNIDEREDEEPGWNCYQFEQLRNGDLLLWDIDIKKEKGALESILGAVKQGEGKTADYLANPSRRAFRKYVKSGGFSRKFVFLHKLEPQELPRRLVSQMDAEK